MYRRPSALSAWRQAGRQNRCRFPPLPRGVKTRLHHRHFVTLMLESYVSATA